MPDWKARALDDQAHSVVMRIEAESGDITSRALLDLMARSGAFRRFLRDALAGSRFEAFFWETPPVTLDTLDRPFEMALVDAPALARTEADPSAFADHFAHTTADVVTFANLGRDAVLVVPSPRGPQSAYGHFARFLREGAAEQVDVVLAEVGRAATARVSATPMWMSTAGLGVSWLHVRLDDRPKYYRHAPYTRLPRSP